MDEEKMRIATLRSEISAFLKFSLPAGGVPFERHDVVKEQGYDRLRITYRNEEDESIPAFLLLPHGTGPFPAVLLHHQHAGQRHLGKSEVCGLAGDPLQAFGPALAGRGLVVLAPDSICFEDRRANRSGIEPDPGTEADTMQHYNEMCYRLLRGDTLMRRVLVDAAYAVSILHTHPAADSARIGTMGHSYGGNTVLFHAALDERLAFACASGAACTYACKMEHGTGIELAEVIPGFTQQFDIQDLVKCMAPREMLLVSASEDVFSQDAAFIARAARETFATLGAADNLMHNEYIGGHPLTQERFDDIVEWILSVC